MIKTAGIYYFSGTGNTALVAGMIQSGLAALGCAAELIPVEDVLGGKRTPDMEGFDLVGFGSQVIGFTTPSVMMRFIKLLPKQNGKRAFVFRTAGGVATVNYNASRPMLRALGRRGFDVFHERLFAIGSNWINRFDDAVVAGLAQATRRKTALMCEALLRGEARHLETGRFQRLKMGLVGRVTPAFFRVAGKDMAVDQAACTQCGLCARHCPAGNITLKQGKVRFGWQCNCCLRCVYACPAKAIRFKHLGFFAVPGGYDIQATLAHPQPADPTGEKPAPRFYQAYLANDAL